MATRDASKTRALPSPNSGGKSSAGGPLTGKQRRKLRALGHHLKPVVMVGQDDVSEGVVASVVEQLLAHELIKVKVGEGASSPRAEVAESLATETRSELVQMLGRTILLYRRHPEKPKIEL